MLDSFGHSCKSFKCKKPYCFPKERGENQMSSLKDTVERLKSLENEKQGLLAEIEDLKRIAEAKSNSLANEIAALKEEINSLKDIIEPQEPPPPPSAESLK
jgi:septal ring factor EnvC (AmiA/AmiB activator)